MTPFSAERGEPRDFAGKLALVTGSGRGLGREIALQLASRGARLGLLARTRTELDEVAELVRHAGAQAFVLVADLVDPEQVDRALTQLVTDAGAVELLINNAGVPWPTGPPSRLDASSVRDAVAINLAAPIELALRVLPVMLTQGHREIVNVSADVSKLETAPGLSVYFSSKTGLEAFSRGLAAELSETPVHVNAFRPGAVDTALVQCIFDQPDEEIGPLKSIFEQSKAPRCWRVPRPRPRACSFVWAPERQAKSGRRRRLPELTSVNAPG